MGRSFMEEKEFEITKSLLGGYNKKQTVTYIEALKSMVEEIQAEKEAAEVQCVQLKQSIAEAESCYKALWERCKAHEQIIKAQEKTIKEQENRIKVQEKAIKEQENRIKTQENRLENQKAGNTKQEQMLKELLDKDYEVSYDEIEKKIKKQFKKLKSELKQKKQKKNKIGKPEKRLTK